MKYLTGFFMILMLASSCVNHNIAEIERRYGLTYNKVRRSVGMPVVTPEMELREDIQGRRFLYSIPNRDRSLLSLWWKELLTDSSLNLYLEKDFYYNPQTEEWLVIGHSYSKGTTTYLYQDYFTGTDRTISDWSIVDSLLRTWGLVVD